MLKKIDSKGFTFVELLAVIAIIGILSGIATMAVSSYIKKSEKKVYKSYETNMKVAAQQYLLKNSSDIPNQGSSKILDVEYLQSESFLEKLTDPKNNGKMCYGTIEVINNGNIGTGVNSNTKNLDLVYKVCLYCSGYTSAGCPTS